MTPVGFTVAYVPPEMLPHWQASAVWPAKVWMAWVTMSEVPVMLNKAEPTDAPVLMIPPAEILRRTVPDNVVLFAAVEKFIAVAAL